MKKFFNFTLFTIVFIAASSFPIETSARAVHIKHASNHHRVVVKKPTLPHVKRATGKQESAIQEENSPEYVKKLIAKHYSDYKVPDNLHLWVSEASKKYNINPSILLSTIRYESGFRTDVTLSGNVGLMQVRPRTWKRTYSDMKNGHANIMQGSKIIDEYRAKTGSISGALHAYNVGITAYKNGKRNSLYVSRIITRSNHTLRDA